MKPFERIFAASILVAGLGLLYPLQRWIDATSPVPPGAEETLYLSSGKAIKKMTLGLDALAADIYWIRTVQYFGRKLIDSGMPLSSAMTKEMRMGLLAPLLDIVVTLDPHHIPAYRFGAIFLPERNMPAAIALVEKGISENPDEWRLYQDIGYIYWQAGNSASGEEQTADYAKAAEWYDRGTKAPGAPWWMRDLAGMMMVKGGSREAARLVYSAYVASDDPNIRGQAVERLKHIRSLDELDAINNLLVHYKEQTSSCPLDLRVLAPTFRSMELTVNDDALPVDPDGFPYVYSRAKCKAELAFESTVPR